MMPAALGTLAVGALLVAGCATSANAAARPDPASPAARPSCDLAAATPWITRWLSAWELTSGQILRLPDALPPDLVFYDSLCVYTTSRVTAPRAAARRGPSLRGRRLEWWTALHGDSLTLPNATRVPVQLMSFADSDRRTGPFFVMAAPAYWKQVGRDQEPGLTAVFLHEFAHTRQMSGVAAILGPIDSTWSFPQELNDDIVQKRFETDSLYVAAYRAERELVYRAAAADSLAEVRVLAGQALAMMRERHARWFTGENAVFATLDATFLSLEGAGQWAGYAWLVHPAGAGMERAEAIDKMLGRRRWWSQDEGLGLFLVVDRLLRAWPSLVFGQPSLGAVELLERAVRQ